MGICLTIPVIRVHITIAQRDQMMSFKLATLRTKNLVEAQFKIKMLSNVNDFWNLNLTQGDIFLPLTW